MESYKRYIKKRVLMAAGIIIEEYEDSNPPKNKFGSDEVDILILNKAVKLADRHTDIFGLLYKCHEVNQTKGRVRLRNEKELGILTFNRYISDSRNHVVKLIIDDQLTIKKIKKIIG